MLSVLQKVTASVICIINDKEFLFVDGRDAYEAFKFNYLIESIYARDNSIVFKLKEIKKSQNWKEEYVKQFGREPSFFE